MFAGSRSWTSSAVTSVKTQARTRTAAPGTRRGRPEPGTGRRVGEKGPVLGLGDEGADTPRG